MKQSSLILPDWKKIIGEHATPANSCGNDFFYVDSSVSGALFASMSEPFAMEDMMVIVFCERGEARFALDMREYDLQAPFMATIRNKKIFEVRSSSADYSAFYYCFSENFGNKLFSRLHDIYEFNRSVRERPAFSITESNMETIKANRDLILAALEETSNPYQQEAIRCLVQSLYFTFKTRYFMNTPRNMEGSHSDNIVNRFFALVRDYHNKERELSFYANKLCMTPKYLSRVIKLSTNKTAYSWVTEAVIQEAKMMLKCTDSNIAEISEQLGFSSQVFFSKYFKNATGMSPRDYRKSMENN